MADLLLSVKIWSNCQGLKNKNRDARQKAAQALQEIGAPAVDALIKMLDSKEWYTNVSTVQALGNLADPRSVIALSSAYRNPNAEVRQAVAAALGEIDDMRGVDTLIYALRDSIASIREAAALALGKLADPKAADALAVAVKDEEKGVAWRLPML